MLAVVAVVAVVVVAVVVDDVLVVDLVVENVLLMFQLLIMLLLWFWWLWLLWLLLWLLLFLLLISAEFNQVNYNLSQVLKQNSHCKLISRVDSPTSLPSGGLYGIHQVPHYGFSQCLLPGSNASHGFSKGTSIWIGWPSPAGSAENWLFLLPLFTGRKQKRFEKKDGSVFGEMMRENSNLRSVC